MNRQPPTQAQTIRLEQLVNAATNVFTTRGYRRTGMADIAREMGVAPGTLYLYAASKEALFDLAVRWHFGLITPDAPPELPVRAPAREATLQTIERSFEIADYLPTLAAAVANGPQGDPAQELRAVLTEAYDTLVHYRKPIRLVERSSLDWPELAQLFFRLVRQSMFDLFEAYIEQRTAAGVLRPQSSVRAAARFVSESLSWFAMHRLGERYVPFTDAEARATCVEMLFNSLHPGPAAGAATRQTSEASTKGGISDGCS